MQGGELSCCGAITPFKAGASASCEPASISKGAKVSIRTHTLMLSQRAAQGSFPDLRQASIRPSPFQFFHSLSPHDQTFLPQDLHDQPVRRGPPDCDADAEDRKIQYQFEGLAWWQ